MDNQIVFWSSMLPVGGSNQKEHGGGFWTINRMKNSAVTMEEHDGSSKY